MSHQDDFGGIDLPVCFEVIHHPTVTPCPGGDCLSAVCRNVSFRWMTEEGENTFRISVLAVGEEVEVMDGGQPVTGVDDLFHRPARCLVAAWAVGILRRDDIRVRRNCLIPLEVEMQEYRHFCFDMVRQIHQQQGFPFYTVMAECDFDLFAGGTAVDGTVVVVQLLVGHIHFVRRHLSIYLFGKDGQQFRPSGLFPLLHGCYFPAVASL